MNIFKKIGLLLIMFLVGGIVMQSLGYIDSWIFAWFTDIEFFEVVQQWVGVQKTFVHLAKKHQKHFELLTRSFFWKNLLCNG